MPKIALLSDAHMNDHTFIQMLHEVAQDSSKVKFFDHAIERMEQRNITSKQIIDTLRRGFLVESIIRDVRGDWVGKVSHTSAGERITVVAKLKKQNGTTIIVITTYKE